MFAFHLLEVEEGEGRRGGGGGGCGRVQSRSSPSGEFGPMGTVQAAKLAMGEDLEAP